MMEAPSAISKPVIKHDAVTFLAKSDSHLISVFLQPKLIVTASFGIEPGRRVEYIPLVEKALELSSHRPSKVLVYNRPNMVRSSMHTLR